ncbi:MAG: hypothetical protein ACRCXV_01335, partial [Bacteroidales bacterium]
MKKLITLFCVALMASHGLIYAQDYSRGRSSNEEKGNKRNESQSRSERLKNNGSSDDKRTKDYVRPRPQTKPAERP